MNALPPTCSMNPADVRILQEICSRVGCQSPEILTSAVATAFMEAQTGVDGAHMARHFRACPSYGDFTAALKRAGELFPAPSVLVLGIGKGFTGRDSAYAAQVVHEWIPQGKVTRLDVTPTNLYQPAAARYDLIVSHSLAHFLFDQTAFYAFVRARLDPAGAYVMGGEPNARYWKNSECLARLKEMEESRRKARALHPRRYLGALVRFFRKPAPMPAFERSVNSILRERYGLSGDLTRKEMNRIADPYFPDELPGEHPLGGKGIDWEADLVRHLPGFRLEFIGTARFLGKTNPNNLPPAWQKVNAELEQRFPQDGNVFSALWVRSEAR